MEVCKSLSLVAMYSSMRDWRLRSINSELRVRVNNDKHHNKEQQSGLAAEEVCGQNVASDDVLQ